MNDDSLDFIEKKLKDNSDDTEELAQQDLGEELLNRIDEFLESRKDVEPALEIKKIVFEDASKIEDSQINSIIDSFVRITDDDGLSDLDRKSLDRILILFNEWLIIGKRKHESIDDLLPAAQESPPQQQIEERQGLDRQIAKMGSDFTQIYEFKAVNPDITNIYKPVPVDQGLYVTKDVQFRIGPDDNSDNPYYASGSLYKYT